MFYHTRDVFQRPRGTRDFLPEDMDKRRYIESRFRETFISYGYREVNTPTFEYLDLFTAKSGESIIEEIYSFKDKSGRELALRPELTAPVIRMYVEKLQMKPKPLKLFYFGNCFRYDRPQKGRYREFTQAGCELIGYSKPEGLAELISLAWSCLKKVGLKDIKLKVGNLNILNRFLEYLGIDGSIKKEIIPLIDKREYDIIEEILTDKISKEVASKLKRFLDVKNIDEIKALFNDKDVFEEINRFERIISYLKTFGVESFEISMEIVRGLDYYKGMVFEIESPSLGAERQICGGGEYDLVGLFGGKDVLTAGFAIGFDRVIISLENEGFEFPEYNLDYYIIPIGEDVLNESIKIATRLRERGYKTDIDLTGRSLKKSMKYADSIGVKKVMIVGKKDLSEGKVTIRDMETGSQKKVEVDFQ